MRKRNLNLRALIPCFLVLAFVVHCVRGQDASEVADLLLVETIRAAATSPSSTTPTSGTTTVPATFTVVDKLDGTVQVDLLNLLWAKCRQASTTGANMYNPGGNNCTAAAAGTFTFCGASDDTCNGGVPAGVLNGGGTSEVWDTCANLNLGGRTDWRVPTKDEIVLFFFQVFQNNAALFDAGANNYWTVNSSSTANGYQLQASTGLLSSTSPKTSALNVRCVVTLP